MENLAGDVEQLTLQGGKLALKVFKAITIIQEKRSVVVEVLAFCFFLVPCFVSVNKLVAQCYRNRNKFRTDWPPKERNVWTPCLIGSFSGCKFLRELCSFQWVANPVNDMYADAVLAVILQVESNPTTAQGKYYSCRHNFIAYKVFMGFLLRTKIACDLRRFGGHFELF